MQDQWETKIVKTGGGVRQGLFVADSVQLVQLLPYKRDIKIHGQVTHTVKYADDVLLMAKEETVLQGTTDRLTETGRCYGMKRGKN